MDAPTLLQRLRVQGRTLAVAESTCGGHLLARLIDPAGASDVVVGGVVAYWNDLKRDLLGVRAEDLATHGTVSEAVARAMAIGIRDRTGAALGLSETGIAGPQTGRRSPKPVGTAWLAVADAKGVTTRQINVGSGTRNDVMSRIAEAALDLLWETQAADGAPESSKNE